MDRPYAGAIGINLNSTSGPAYGGFIPTHLPGCVLWLRADLGITKDGSDRVSAWADQSGLGHDVTQGVGSEQPLWEATAFNGYPCVTANGLDEHMQSAAWTLNQPSTVFAVARLIAATAVPQTLVDGTAVNTRRLYENGGAEFRIYAGSVGPSTAADTSRHVLAAVFDGASSMIYKDNTGVAGSCGSSAASGVALFRPGGAAVQYGNFELAELALFDSALAAASIARLSQYAGARYGITVA